KQLSQKSPIGFDSLAGASQALRCRSGNGVLAGCRTPKNPSPPRPYQAVLPCLLLRGPPFCSRSAAVTSSCQNRGFPERGALRRTLATGIGHPGRDCGSSAVLEAYVCLLPSARGWLTLEGLSGSHLPGDARLCSSTPLNSCEEGPVMVLCSCCGLLGREEWWGNGGA
uniref:Uncharacterized protein n=1 Tax=Aquila chrysaetos chrysaetos TaxID=223781 RepID=A0A663F281_AQUCH